MEQLILGDCLEKMKEIPDGKIDLTVTSPPYDNLRTYNGSLDWGEHVWKPCIQELFRITKEGGVVVWVVGDATIKGSETGTSFRQALYFREIGFNLHDTMIWEKDTFSAIGALKTRYAPVFEYMFIFTKGTLETFNPIKDKVNKYFGDTVHGTIRKKNGGTKDMVGKNIKTIAEFGQRNNVWRINSQRQRGDDVHPAPFPEKLAHDHIISWSNEGDIVLDPFMGSGTTCKMAKILNRDFFGIEKDETYFSIASERIKNCQLPLI